MAAKPSPLQSIFASLRLEFNKEISAAYSRPLTINFEGVYFIYLINLKYTLTSNSYSERSIVFRFTVLFVLGNLFVDYITLFMLNRLLEHHVMHLLYKAYTHMRGLKFTRMNWDTAAQTAFRMGNQHAATGQQL